jgi:hypothetical protein
MIPLAGVLLFTGGIVNVGGQGAQDKQTPRPAGQGALGYERGGASGHLIRLSCLPVAPDGQRARIRHKLI